MTFAAPFAATPSLDQVFASTTLPGLPQSAITLTQLSQNPEAGPPQFARVVEADPGLMGQVLRFANSAFFGFSREITSVQQVLTLVGTRAITNFALWNAVFTVIPNPQFGPFDLRSLWQDSLRRALLARHLGKALKLPAADDLFAAALLQDMAIPILLKELPAHYADLLNRRDAESIRLSQLEQQFFGWNHGEAAALLAKKWHLPETLSDLIRHHTELDHWLGAGPGARPQTCVALCSCLPSCTDAYWAEQELFVGGFARLAGPDSIDLRTLLSKVDEDAAEFAPLMRLPIPAHSLCSILYPASDR